MPQVALFNGKNMEGWHARGGASEHAWAAIGDVALNSDDHKLLAATPGEDIFYNGPTGRTADLYPLHKHLNLTLAVP